MKTIINTGLDFLLHLKKENLITGREFIVGTVLVNHFNNDGKCYPSLDRISLLSGVSKGNTSVAIRKLSTVGFIKIQDNNDKNRCFHTYYLSDMVPNTGTVLGLGTVPTVGTKEYRVGIKRTYKDNSRYYKDINKEGLGEYNEEEESLPKNENSSSSKPPPQKQFTENNSLFKVFIIYASQSWSVQKKWNINKHYKKDTLQNCDFLVNNDCIQKYLDWVHNKILEVEKSSGKEYLRYFNTIMSNIWFREFKSIIKMKQN